MRLYSLLLLLLFLPTFFTAQSISPALLQQMRARSVGPAGMSGRITSIDVVLEDPDVWYIGTASGGLWKTVNGGISFNPIFDTEAIMSIGAVAIAQQNPDIIYVGTGEGNPRNTVSSGAGIYKSLDGGKTWECLGLQASRNIHRILIHPKNPDIVWVGAIGPPFGQTAERGLFKSTDGGKSWRKVLFTNTRSGIADLVMDAANPNKLFAAMWEHQRTAWDFTSGGEGSGLHMSTDMGENWKLLDKSNGLPPSPWGRIGIAIAPSDPDQVFALIESKKNALYKSKDGGLSWKKINEKTIGSRPFYFSELYVDPKDTTRIYNLYSRLALSENGGKDFEVIEDWGRKVHADHHAMWIHPNDPDFIILGTDGGLYWTKDKTKHWNFADDLPVAQFYHVAVDMELPYNIYGGLQDNGTWYGPAYTWHRAGLRNSYWKELAFNDGFDVMLDPNDKDIAYALWQGGMLVRVNKRNGQRKTIKPVEKEISLRFNWNAAVAMDPFDSKTIFIGSQFVHKSTSRGNSWTIISPDLTTNDPQKQQQHLSGGLSIDATDAENHTTISCISPSPLQKDMLWVGTDDGNVQLTEDGGKNWVNLSGPFEGLAANSWVNQLKASAHDAEEAFVVFDNHRRDDWTPYVYQTKDKGRHWRRIVSPEQVEGFALSFVQDPEVPQLMFLGTEFGLYISLDAGDNWQPWRQGIPAVSIADMLIHPREKDLVIATFGRAMYVLDDIGPLRELASNRQSILDKKLTLFEVPDATLGIIRQADGQRLSPDRIYRAENRPYGAIISFWVNEVNPGDSVQVQILDEDDLIFEDKVAIVEGLNRTSWNLQRKGKAIYGPLMDPILERPWVIPGNYALKLSFNEAVTETSVRVIPDPMIKYDQESAEASQALRNRLESLFAQKDSLVSQLKAKADRYKIEGRTNTKAIILLRETQELLQMIEPKPTQGVGNTKGYIGPEIDKAFYYMHSPYEMPSANDYSLISHLEKKWSRVFEEIRVKRGEK